MMLKQANEKPKPIQKPKMRKWMVGLGIFGALNLLSCSNERSLDATKVGRQLTPDGLVWVIDSTRTTQRDGGTDYTLYSYLIRFENKKDTLLLFRRASMWWKTWEDNIFRVSDSVGYKIHFNEDNCVSGKKLTLLKTVKFHVDNDIGQTVYNDNDLSIVYNKVEGDMEKRINLLIDRRNGKNGINRQEVEVKNHVEEFTHLDSQYYINVGFSEDRKFVNIQVLKE